MLWLSKKVKAKNKEARIPQKSAFFMKRSLLRNFFGPLLFL